MKHTDPQMKIRLPLDVHRHVKLSAKRQERTMNGYIVFLLRQEMEKEKTEEAMLGGTSPVSE
ncbi:Arc family DNA-binding protein [Asaia lannensis]|uniref:Arc family DNA-binding protein n=1 Tax=Asaia lannensis NBRC 102526 TaxID=1307926 RepID=A0ABT1CIJ0_9PROT|nr:Arc family DNA-binding protein [Asaia lannensis]MCO6160684.1 Arc family DNA-binding protein [Asaia lannensis NBRC 102526]GBR01974.1 hypothetical protein AA102526_2676 [Asaia lannensis NBRC 102526]